MNFQKPLLLIGGIIATGGTSTFGVYNWNRVSIESKGQFIPRDSEEGIWEKAYNKSNKEEAKSSKYFNNLFPENNLNSKQLKQRCESLYKSDYSSIFRSENEALKNEVEKFCSIKIKDTLDTTKAIDIKEGDDISNKEIFNKKLNDIKGDSSFLEKIKKESQQSDDESLWKNARDWCGREYKKNYVGNNEDWKFVSKYCVKNQPAL